MNGDRFVPNPMAFEPTWQVPLEQEPLLEQAVLLLQGLRGAGLALRLLVAVRRD